MLLRFVQIEKDNAMHFKTAQELWIPFIQELQAYGGTEECVSAILDGLRRQIQMQCERPDMHFEIAYLKQRPIGIAIFAIDWDTIYDFLDAPGYGTVMDFYIMPAFRRQGFGLQFFMHIQQLLSCDGATAMYVCPTSVIGQLFWRAAGFRDSGKFDLENEQPIYTKFITGTPIS
jgi:Acetyltransferase (GNAT) family.